jgi:hypothetical protein
LPKAPTKHLKSGKKKGKEKSETNKKLIVFPCYHLPHLVTCMFVSPKLSLYLGYHHLFSWRYLLCWKRTSLTLLTVLFRTLTTGHDPVQKVTLVPRGQAQGLTWFIPADDPTLISKQQLFARIVGGLGGRAAEEVIFGESEVTPGAAGDLQQITGLAKQVTKHLK